MKRYIGKSINAAARVGNIYVHKKESINTDRYIINDTDAEIERFNTAKKMVQEKLDFLKQKTLAEVGEKEAQIFEIHKMMTEDDDYNEMIINKITDEKVNAEYAVSVASKYFCEMFSSMDDAYMQARAADVKEISDNIISALCGNRQRSAELFENSIICAEDLAPGETVLFDKNKVAGFVTAYGSASSHTAILAKMMNVPAIIGVGEGFLKEIKDGDTAVIDGYTGELIVDPDEDTLKKAEEGINQEKELQKRLMLLKGKEAVTLSGKKIDVFANIGSVEDVINAVENDASGIGLFRSEFLYLQNSTYPSEEQQYEAYKTVIEKMQNKKVIIRTLDIGADKQVDYFGLEKEENPALGLRGVRICLLRKELFKTQLRALYRASVYGKLGIMFPMITSAEEVRETLKICDEVRCELSEENISFSKEVEHGIMIETPAAALISDILAPMVDFFSIGTNDLIQYTLACDRQNIQLDKFFNPHHEAVLRLIETSAENAHKYGKWIGICGELACDVSLTKHFAKMDIDELSVPAPCVLPLKQTIRSLE